MQCHEYVIKKGDTLYSLARQNGVTVEELIQLNDGIEPTALIPGTTLCIPRGGVILQDPDIQLPKEATPYGIKTTYTVKVGDSLESIAKRNSVSIEQLLFANPDLYPGYLEIETAINIPDSTLPIPGSVPYTVKPGETIKDILKKFAIGYGRLKLFNSNVDLTKIAEGNTIFVPEVLGGDYGSCKVGSYTYLVKEGDTADSIAEKFNVSAKELLESNPALQNAKPGDVICLPLVQYDDV